MGCSVNNVQDYISNAKYMQVSGPSCTTPYGTRFIAASNRCTTKQLSALLTSCFKTINTHLKQYCKGIYKHTGVNCFWIIDNSKEVLDRLQNINKNSRATSFDSYDFTTLYTNIPYDTLKNNIRVLVCEGIVLNFIIIWLPRAPSGVLAFPPPPPQNKLLC